MGQLLRTSFARELETLQTDTLMLGSMVIQALKESVEALRQRDMETAKRLIKEDEVINKKRFEIEADCLRLIATQQPMAGNLRLIAAVLEISTELEADRGLREGYRTDNLTDRPGGADKAAGRYTPHVRYRYEHATTGSRCISKPGPGSRQDNSFARR